MKHRMFFMKIIPSLPPIVAPDHVSIPVDLSRFDLPPRISTYVKKPEFHVTLVGNSHRLVDRAMSRGMTREDAIQFSMNTCRMALQNESFEIFLLPRFIKVEKPYSKPVPHTRRSIAILCLVETSGPTSRVFHEILSQIYGAEVVAPPSHIMLYTQDDKMSREGVDIETDKDMESYAKETTDPLIVEPLAALY
jgi:hypothetical protein